MNRNKHGILCAANVARKKLSMTATKDAGEYVTAPKYMFELTKHHADMDAAEICFTPCPREMKQLQREGYAFVQTHETKMKGEQTDDDYTKSNRE